jgi:hypothetical protein
MRAKHPEFLKSNENIEENLISNGTESQYRTLKSRLILAPLILASIPFSLRRQLIPALVEFGAAFCELRTQAIRVVRGGARGVLRLLGERSGWCLMVVLIFDLGHDQKKRKL